MDLLQGLYDVLTIINVTTGMLFPCISLIFIVTYAFSLTPEEKSHLYVDMTDLQEEEPRPLCVEADMLITACSNTTSKKEQLVLVRQYIKRGLFTRTILIKTLKRLISLGCSRVESSHVCIFKALYKYRMLSHEENAQIFDAYHHQGVSQEEKDFVEQLFEDNFHNAQSIITYTDQELKSLSN